MRGWWLSLERFKFLLKGVAKGLYLLLTLRDLDAKFLLTHLPPRLLLLKHLLHLFDLGGVLLSEVFGLCLQGLLDELLDLLRRHAIADRPVLIDIVTQLLVLFAEISNLFPKFCKRAGGVIKRTTEQHQLCSKVHHRPLIHFGSGFSFNLLCRSVGFGALLRTHGHHPVIAILKRHRLEPRLTLDRLFTHGAVSLFRTAVLFLLFDLRL